MGTSPITARSLQKPYHIKADEFGRAYKDYLSDFRTWKHQSHTQKWLIFPRNIVANLSIDETAFTNGDLYTIISNKDAHGRKGALLAIVSGTKVEDVVAAIQKIHWYLLGLLVSLGGYPLAYCIHEGNKYEGHTMLPTINEFVSKYGLENFVVVADSGLMNNANIAELEAHGYKYIIGAKIKNESQEVKNWILEQPKRDCQMVEYDKGGGRRLLVGYTDDRAKKDAYNREKGIRRLEKAYKHGALTKGNINKRGYNKFLSMDGEVKVAINYDRVADDSKWDGLKGYLTNTDIPIQDVYTAYHNLWHVERAFRIAKSKIDIRPMFHFTRKRIEAHICICFVALKIYKELERMLKVSEIKMSVGKVLALAKTITTIQIKLPLNKEVYTQTMLMARHQKIAKLFDEDFWVTR